MRLFRQFASCRTENRMIRSIIIWAVAALPAPAQSSSRDAIRGAITDQTGAPVPGAQIFAGNAGASFSGVNGEFTIQPDAQATTLRILAPGFQEWTRPLDGLVAPVAVTLQLAEHRDTVTVSEAPDYSTY